MNSQTKRNYPVRSERLQQRFAHWRQTHPPRSRIAGSLWNAAVKAAGIFGLYRTAQTLGVNYDALQKRVEGTSRAPVVPREEDPAATFIELPPLVSVDSGNRASGSYECTLEWEDAGSVKLRLRLQGIAVTDLAALCRSLQP